MKPAFALLLVGLCAQVQLGESWLYWTKWYDRDDPSVTGDWEVVSALWPRPCGGKAVLIQVRVKGDPTVVASAGERISVGPNYGLSCQKVLQADRNCLDYSVQYLVPRISRRFDRDNPSGTGDWETKANENGNDWKSGSFIYWFANDLNYGLVDERLELGPRYGLLCRNSVQADKQCRDYEVRFQCRRVGWFRRNKVTVQKSAPAPAKLPQPT